MDFAAIIIAVAFVVLVGYLVPMLLQVKRTVGQSERLLIRLNHELPGILKDVKGTCENTRALTDQAKLGVDRATIFFNAVGDVGQSVNHVHRAVRGKGGAFVVGVTSLLAGLKAASATVRKRVHKDQEGGPYYGD